MLTILQGSDLHYGKPHIARVAAAFHEAVRRAEPDVIVLAGDFTQRAKVREYRQARECLDTLPDVPVIVTPGNHDIPLYRVHERLINPLRNYRTYISSDLDSVTRVEGAVFVALCSAEPHRAIVNGRLRGRQLEFAARIFQECAPEDVRILVTHHPLARPQDGGSDGILPGSGALLDSFRKMGVELILSGHLHRSYVVTTSGGDSVGGAVAAADSATTGGAHGDVAIVHSGTTTSDRGRMAERGRNSLNVLKIGAHEMVVTPHWFEEDQDRFVARAPTSIPRRS